MRRFLSVTLLAFMAGCGQSNKPAPASKGEADAPTAEAAAAEPFGDLYAPFGEEVRPAEGAVSAPLRPRKGDTLYRLSNPRVETPGPSPFPKLVLDCERTRDGTASGELGLVVRAAGRKDETLRIGMPPRDRVDRIEIAFRTGFPFAGDLPALKNCEYFLTVTDPSYGAGFRAVFKVSPSALVGEVKGGVTRARAWTADEAATLRNPPPRWPAANVHHGVGQDTPFAGDPAGNLPTFRYAESGRPLLGLEWNVWAWEGQPCLAHLYPIFERDMPLHGIMPGVRRELAKPGYAVGGITVKATKLTHAMKVTYFRRKPDGTLDPSERYTSDWLGNVNAPDAKDTLLAADGRPVIGLTLKGGAVINAIALVQEGPKD